MKAIVFHEYGPPNVLQYEDIPDPQPEFGEIRIAVHAATVNRVLDVALRSGSERHYGAVLPCIPGVDCAGVVDAIGTGVTRWQIGDRVAATGTMPLGPCPDDELPYIGPVGMFGINRPGGFAEYAIVPARAAIPVPPNLDFHTAAVAIRHVPMAWNLLHNTARVQPGEWVLVLGASGNLGSIGVQIAKAVLGARVIAAAGSDERAAIGRALGAELTINYAVVDLYNAVMDATADGGVDVVYDNVGNPAVFPKAFATLRLDGRLVTAGAHGGPHVALDMHHLYSRRITIRGMFGRSQADEVRSLELVADGLITLRIGRVLPLSQAADAHRLMEGLEDVGKIVLDPTLG